MQLGISSAASYHNADYQYKYGLGIFEAKNIAILPKSFQLPVRQKYQSDLKKSGISEALSNISQIKKQLSKGYLLASNDAEICAYAKKCAGEAYTVSSRYLIADMSLYYVREYAKSKGIEPHSEEISQQGQFARLLCEKWWRRALRKSIARKVEELAIDLGLVCKQKGIYASDETVNRRQQQKRRNSNLLKTIVAINEENQEYTLEALSALNVSNPKLRRAELMTRIAGFDELAIKHEHRADFYTLTCPSKYHAMGYDGKKNPKYQGFTPKQAQEFLTSTFSKLRAYLAKHNVRIYGFRVAEPHHDGTPHWHMILFYEKQYTQFVRDAIKTYWLKEDGDEDGAQKYRFQVQAIDRSKGSAAGYLAKYISKNIDAHGVGGEEDYEGGELDANVNRVDAWAACWGIRQFQQIGGAPVGIYRETRRLQPVTGTDTGILYDLFIACDDGNWAAYTELQGGAFVKRRDLKAVVNYEFFAEARTLYDGRGLKRLLGLNVLGVCIQTRNHEWHLKRGDLSPSWSSVNNCNQKFEESEVLGPVKENINHFVRQKPPIIFSRYAGTGIKTGEKITEFDNRMFKHG